MGVMLRKLVQQVSYMDFKLVAGEKGLSNEVSWTHMVDSDSVSAFLTGQELAFTTGLGLGEKLTLIQLVKDVYKHGASGIVINIGPYISEIGEDVITFANEHDFPVFQVPWEVRMAEIMRIFSFSITKAEQSEIELTSALSNAFRCPAQEELYVSTLMQKGWILSWKYSVAVIKILNNGEGISEPEIGKIGSRLNSYLSFNYAGVISCSMENFIVVVMSNFPADKKEKMLTDVLKYTLSMTKKDSRGFLTCGRDISGLNMLHKSYGQAVKMSELLALYRMPGEVEINNQNKLLMYEKMGMYRLILTITDRDEMIDYVKDTVKPLYEYDSHNHGDMVKTIQCYLKHNGSVKEVADEMIVHRNTVNYKIKKAEEILGSDLSSFDERFQLSLGFLVFQMLSTIK